LSLNAHFLYAKTTIKEGEKIKNNNNNNKPWPSSFDYLAIIVYANE
jgi:hypothetical protein